MVTWGNKEGLPVITEEAFSGPAKALEKSLSVLLDIPRVGQHARTEPLLTSGVMKKEMCLRPPHNVSPTDSARHMFILKTSVDEEPR